MMRSPDLRFAIESSQGGMGEIELGRLASQKAVEPEVRAFGQQMIDDHGKANDVLKSWATEKSIRLPDALDAMDQSTRTKLEGLSGVKFDKAYVKAMVKHHRGNLKSLKKQAKIGKDPQLKEFASTALPVVQSHLAKLDSIAAALKGKR